MLFSSTNAKKDSDLNTKVTSYIDSYIYNQFFEVEGPQVVSIQEPERSPIYSNHVELVLVPNQEVRVVD